MLKDQEQVLRDALELIDRDGCENLTHGRCFDRPERVRGACFSADAWCAPCVARKALDDSLGAEQSKHLEGAVNEPLALCEIRRAVNAPLIDEKRATHIPHRPQRGDDVERWLHRQRDAWNRTGERPEFRAIDSLLDRYRECANYGLTLLTENDERGDP